MSDHCTDDDVRAATEALMPFYGDDVIASPREHSARFARAVLDAVAPAIAARALRQLVEELNIAWGDLYGRNYRGAIQMPDEYDRSTHLPLKEWLRARADEIEAGQ